jgi:exodeoxyribonuclease III
MSGTLRIVSWNIEDLGRHLALPPASPRPPKPARKPMPPLAETVTRLGDPDILCLQEVRLRPQDDLALRALGERLPGYRAAWSLCDDPRNVTFRGGRMYGVVTLVKRDLASEALPRPGFDREGRLLMVELPALGLCVGNVYAVNGTSKPYFDHELGRVSGTRHELKRRFIESLAAHARSVKVRGLELVLVGDWNVSRTALDTFPRLRTEEPHATARRTFDEELIGGLELVDVFRHVNPEARRYTWFNRQAPPGKLDAARVDFALLSAPLLDRVVEADILDGPKHLAGSDHAPLSVTLRVP